MAITKKRKTAAAKVDKNKTYTLKDASITGKRSEYYQI